jgi:hypothetical protein
MLKLLRKNGASIAEIMEAYSVEKFSKSSASIPGFAVPWNGF